MFSEYSHLCTGIYTMFWHITSACVFGLLDFTSCTLIRKYCYMVTLSNMSSKDLKFKRYLGIL